jgi:hypothetical protein
MHSSIHFESYRKRGLHLDHIPFVLCVCVCVCVCVSSCSELLRWKSKCDITTTEGGAEKEMLIIGILPISGSAAATVTA